MTAAINAGAYLHHVQFESGDPAAMARFYAEAMDMTAHEQGREDWFCEGPDRRILFTKGRDRRLGYAAFACRDGAALQTLRVYAQDRGVAVSDWPDQLFEPGAFCVDDPDGNRMAFGVSRNSETKDRPGLRAPLQHLTLATRDPSAIEDFYVGTLGFLPSDRVRADDGSLTTLFMRSNHEHHTLACFAQDRIGIDHHSYEAGDWTVIKRWCDRLGDRGIPIMWGPGRHGPGNNLFVFIEDPDRNWIEISAELEVVVDRPVREWRHEPRTLNRWGSAIMRT